MRRCRTLFRSLVLNAIRETEWSGVREALGRYVTKFGGEPNDESPARQSHSSLVRSFGGRLPICRNASASPNSDHQLKSIAQGNKQQERRFN